MKIKILLVEDEKDIRRLLKMHLSNEGYEIIEADNGQVAIDLFDEGGFQLVILDIMLPVVDGLEVLEYIRGKSELPILMLTAMNTDTDKVLGLGMGADDYIVKPFSIIEVISRVKAHLRRYMTYTGISKTEILHNGNLTLDAEKHLFTKNGVEIMLLPKEFKILSYLMNNLEHVFTKKRLYEAVWEEDYFGDDNTIMVQISNLRDKIEDDPKNPVYIKTIRGIGYRMVTVDKGREVNE